MREWLKMVPQSQPLSTSLIHPHYALYIRVKGTLKTRESLCIGSIGESLSLEEY